MCQPGRPGPHGDGHAGSPGLADFQSAKSSGIVLALVDVDARAGTLTKIVDVAVHECAVVVEAIDVEVHAAALDGVRVAAVDEQRDDVDHLRHVLGGPRSKVGRRDPEAVHLIDVGPLVLRRDLVFGPFFARRRV